jgi:malonyl-CoA O-methyltransferase
LKSTTSQNLDKQLVADSFRASGATYEENATVQKEISRQLVRFLQGCDCIDSTRVLEIGCCTGILTELLVESLPVNTIYLNDIVQEFCITAAARVAGRVSLAEPLPGDIETCALPRDLGLVVSSATFQWMADLPTLVRKIHHVLGDKGYLVFSIFGPGTMGEIRALTGRSLSYHSPEELTAMLQDDFRICSLQSETRVLHFPSVRAVLHHIRETGVGGIGRSKWMPGRFKEFERQYKSRFATDRGLPVTYASTFVVARKR